MTEGSPGCSKWPNDWLHQIGTNILGEGSWDFHDSMGRGWTMQLMHRDLNFRCLGIFHAQFYQILSDPGFLRDQPDQTIWKHQRHQRHQRNQAEAGRFPQVPVIAVCCDSFGTQGHPFRMVKTWPAVRSYRLAFKPHWLVIVCYIPIIFPINHSWSYKAANFAIAIVNRGRSCCAACRCFRWT